MSIGIIGKKIGQTRLFTDEGQHIGVTVIEAKPNQISQIKTTEKEGYNALQVSFGEQKIARLNKPVKGHYAKNGINPGRGLTEFRLDMDSANLIGDHQVGDEITVDLFNDVNYVDVSGISKGKGFQGGVKRHNFRTQDATHGNSLSHRAIGSTGQNQSPGKVFKGKKMPGQMGNKAKTVMSLRLVEVIKEKNLLLIQGSVPGYSGSFVRVRPAIKRS